MHRTRKKRMKAVVLAAALAFGTGSGQAGTSPFLGEITMIAGSYCPDGWLPLDGRLLSIPRSPELFQLIGSTYGGDGRKTYALPDMRSRAPVGAGRSPELPHWPTQHAGQKGGADRLMLPENAMPYHDHTFNATNHPATTTNPVGTFYAAPHEGPTVQDPDFLIYGPPGADPNTQMSAGMIESWPRPGQQSAIDVISPSLGVLFCISMRGSFPQR